MLDKPTQSIGKRFVVSALPDESVAIEQTTQERRRPLAPAFLVNGPLWVLFGYVGVQYLQFTEGKFSPLSDPLALLGVGLILIAMGQLLGLVWTLFGREQWLVRPNELRRRRSIFGRTWETTFRDGKFQIRRTQGRFNHYWLYCRVPERRFRVKIDDTLKMGSLEELTELMATRLGWTVERTWK